MDPPTPEAYCLSPTPHVPNSPLPALVYRNVLGPSPTADSTRQVIEKNQWLQGGVFKTYSAHHFHSVTHECYAVFKGSSRLLLGRGPLDEEQENAGIEVDVREGDVIVLPAGVSHCSISSEGEYEYVGLYPAGSPKYDNNFCKADEEETEEKARVARNVPVPSHDPIYGPEGPLVKMWREAATAQ